MDLRSHFYIWTYANVQYQFSNTFKNYQIKNMSQIISQILLWVDNKHTCDHSWCIN